MLISDDFVDARVRDDLVVPGRNAMFPAEAESGGARLPAFAGAGGDLIRYRSRLLPHVCGADLVEVLDSHDTVSQSGGRCAASARQPGPASSRALMRT